MKQTQHWKRHFNSWALLSCFFIIIILFPTVLVGSYSFAEPTDNWSHIKEYLLTDIIKNTVSIMAATAIITSILGTSLAWLTTIYTFPFRNFFRWGLILPLAIPPFIGAYTYQGMLDYTGIVQSTLRNQFHLSVNQTYFNLMNMPGTVFIFTVFLFPYMYVITRSFLENQSASLIENARLLGSGPIKIFIQITLPICRTAIVGGITIIMLEVINDYGVVKYFGIQTFITAIIQTWSAMNDLDAAFKLAGTLMTVVIIILLIEKFVRGRKQYSFSTSNVRPIQPQKLSKGRGWLAFSYCLFIFSVSFLIPFVQLIHWALMTYDKILTNEFFALVKHSFTVAFIGAFLIITVAVIIANYTRLYRGFISKIISKVTVLGYSIPGAVIAISVITIFINLDQWLGRVYNLFQLDPLIIFRTSIIMLLTAYVIRFLAVGYNSIEAGFEKVGNAFSEASTTLGVSMFKTFLQVDIPMIRGALFGGFILVFVDILKELPLTMLLQPFNFSTLATKAFQYANNEMVSEAAIASLLIIALSSVCIFFFHYMLEREQNN